MAGKDAILDAAAIQGETHVRATIVEGKHASVVVDEEDRAMAAAHDKAPLNPHLLKGTCAHKI
jgi:hypothetical protein